MKLHEDQVAGAGIVRGYGTGYFDIDGVRHEGAVRVQPGTGATAWPPDAFDALRPEHFAAIVESRPDLVIFGSGATHRFASPELVRPLLQAGIGVESMDSAAACRTYTILSAEGRHVVAALLPL